MKSSILFPMLAALSLPISTTAQSTSSARCAAPSPSGSIRPSVASGYRLQVVATGLSKPRGILIDSAGNLLVVESGIGVVSAHTLNETNGCVTIGQSTNVTSALELNHGIELSSDGRTLYASNTGVVYQWTYDVTHRAVSNQVTLIENMNGSDHTTRTLLLSRRVPGMLTVSRGSLSNLDFQATMISSGLSSIKAFNLNQRGDDPYDYDTSGTLLGWGLRNDVGVAEHPTTGGIWSVENSADDISRFGVDIHANNPAEEMNFLGYLNGTAYAEQGANFGYPWCFTAWNVSALPNNGNLTVGKQFAIDANAALANQNKTDAYCAAQAAPRLSFQAHMAPLDLKFNNSGTQAWVTFHGSWDSPNPVGYKLSVIDFANGQPTQPSTSTTAATDILSNANNSVCPNNCFRPVAMAFDSQGRIFMTSDASGEIYLITRDASSSGSSPSSTSSGSSSSPTNSASLKSYFAHALAVPYIVSGLLMLI